MGSIADWLRFLRRKPQAEAIAEIERIDAGRRGFLGMAIGAGLTAAIDPEALLWTPGKLVSVPQPQRITGYGEIDINSLIARMVDRTEWAWYDTLSAAPPYRNPPIIAAAGRTSRERRTKRPPLPQPLPTRFTPEMIRSFEAIDRARRASPLEIAASRGDWSHFAEGGDED